MPQSAFHYCFHTKKDLYRALLATETEDDLDTIWPTTPATASAAEKVRDLLLALWRGIEVHPDAQLVLFELSDLALRDPDLQELAVWEQQAAVGKASEAITRLKNETGIEFSVPDRIIADSVVATLDGVARGWLRHRDNARAREILTEYATAITKTDSK